MSYIVHAHIERQDGTKHSFWTRTGLTRSEARALAREQRRDGGVARVAQSTEEG